MTKKELDNLIESFKNSLIYEAQFIAFEKKILRLTTNFELKKYITSELKKIKKGIKNGKYKSPPFAKNKLEEKKKTIKNSNKSPLKSRKEILQEISSKKEISYNYRINTCASLCENLEITLPFLERLIKQKCPDISIDPNSAISDKVWNVIEEYTINKLNALESIKKKEKYNEIPTRKKKTRNSLTKSYIGGNFGKLIFIGKTN